MVVVIRYLSAALCCDLKGFSLPLRVVTVLGWRLSLGLIRDMQSRIELTVEAECDELKDSGESLVGFIDQIWLGAFPSNVHIVAEPDRATSKPIFRALLRLCDYCGETRL